MSARLAKFELETANTPFDRAIAVYTPDNMVSKLTLTVEGENAALFESHWWAKYSDDDASIYLSTHSGCPVGCAMCGTSSVSIRKATAEEIIAQFEMCYLDMLKKGVDLERYDQLICKWMYMGEPLLNIYEVDKAMRFIAAKYPEWTMLVSTVAPLTDWSIVEGWIRDFGDKLLLSFSIHDLDYRKRNNLIPYNSKKTINEILKLGERFRALGSTKLSYSYNLFNHKGSQELANSLFEKFSHQDWIPCVQYLYSKIGIEDSEREARNNLIVDDFINKLQKAGYEEVLGFYAPETKGEWHLITGCGQFVEFQRYAKQRGLL